jgi:DNA polymerase-3 subunit gamma/tau
VPAVTTYCAPCLADLALVREAATAVGGTASCMAHAVLLTHPADDSQRRRQRLAALRDTATEKLETAGPEEQLRLEVLVEEYGLASAMESLAPRRRDDGTATTRSARKRRGRERGEREGGPHQGGQPGQQGERQPGQQGGQGRGRGPRPEEAPAGAAAPGGAVADGSAEQQGADALAQVGAPSGEPPATSTDAPASGGDAAPQQQSSPQPSSQEPSSQEPSSSPAGDPQPSTSAPEAPSAPATPAPPPPTPRADDAAGSAGRRPGPRADDAAGPARRRSDQRQRAGAELARGRDPRPPTGRHAGGLIALSGESDRPG